MQKSKFGLILQPYTPQYLTDKEVQNNCILYFLQAVQWVPAHREVTSKVFLKFKRPFSEQPWRWRYMGDAVQERPNTEENHRRTFKQEAVTLHLRTVPWKDRRALAKLLLGVSRRENKKVCIAHIAEMTKGGLSRLTNFQAGTEALGLDKSATIGTFGRLDKKKEQRNFAYDPLPVMATSSGGLAKPWCRRPCSDDSDENLISR